MTDAVTKAELRRLLDEREIERALTRYARGIDRHDAPLIRSAFHEDAVDHHGRGGRSPAELAEWGNAIHEAGTRAHQHFLANPTIDITGDTAHSEVYVLFVLWQRDQPLVEINGGRYLDRWERREGEWRIVERVVIVDWASQASQRDAAYAGGSWDRDDPSYRRPLHWSEDDAESAAARFARVAQR